MSAAIHWIGEINNPLGTIRIGDSTKLIVSPWAALGTDALLMGTSLALILESDKTWMHILGVAGFIWGIAAASIEVAKLIRAD
jgi:hypothetical protein